MAEKLVLVADDDASIRTVLNQALMRAGFEVRVTSNVSTLWQWISEGLGQAVISDVIMPDGDAFELLPRIRKTRPNLPVILISAQNTLTTAIKAEEAGAFEYLPKPFDLDDLVHAVNRAIDEPASSIQAMADKPSAATMPLVGRSSQMQNLYRSIARLMNSDLPILLTGETGSGKGLLARVLHESGDRKERSFAAINLSALAPDDMEGKLFDPKDGLFKKADGGTLYIEEIDWLTSPSQARLLSVMTGQLDVHSLGVTHLPRLVTSATKSLDSAVANGLFREDLYYRLNVVPLDIPPLRKRREDIPDLVRHFIQMSETHGGVRKHVDADAMKLLKSHDWPGNVRELKNLLNRICALHSQETITADTIQNELGDVQPIPSSDRSTAQYTFASLQEAVDQFVARRFDEAGDVEQLADLYQEMLPAFERPLIVHALASTNGNQIKAASILGLNRNTLRKKIATHGIRIVKTAG